MKKFNTLNRSWKEILFSASGFGPNLLMVIMGAYLSNAINPAALQAGGTTGWEYQTISGICLILPVLFSILWTIAKCFDGFIDIPFAALTDGLRTKWGNRRLPIAICFIPMVVSFSMCWYPLFVNADGITTSQQIGNTVWLFFWALIFFATYTMNLIAFYGSLSTVCINEKQRSRVSAYKSFFDTITYCLAYALVPVILNTAQIHIDKLVFFCLPFMLTMIIPLIMIKEGEKWEAKAISMGYDVTPLKSQPPVKFIESLKLTGKNKPFLKWLLVNSCSFFGLQLFLVSMNALIVGGMGLNGTQMTIVDTFAFAPVPLMLYLFNRLKRRKGVRFAFQTSLLSFAVAITAFLIGSTYVMGDNITVKMIIAAAGGIIGSFAIGSFFMMSYLIPSQISTVEEQLTGRNHSSMYFATQAVTTSVAGAISSSLIWENIKNLFFAKGISGIVQAQDSTEAASILGTSASNVYNFGTFIVPMITCAFCLVGFACAFMMPKNYTPRLVGLQIVSEEQYNKKIASIQKPITYPIEGASNLVFNCLWFLSATIFGFAWYSSVIDDVNTFAQKKISKWWVLLIFVCFPLAALLAYKLNKATDEKCLKMKIKTKPYTPLIIIFSLFYLNLVTLSILQHKINLIATIQKKAIDKKEVS